MRLPSHSLLLNCSALAGMMIAAAGCTDFSTTPVSLGRVTVSVTDQNNAGAPLLVVDLLRSDRTLWRSLRTTTDGSGEFGTADGGVIPQSYVVRITPSGSYVLAPAETNDKPVTVVIGQTNNITFKVVKNAVGGPPA